jgi:hypothetical protein
MSSSLIGSLRVALGLDTAQFEAGANKSRSIARGLTRDIEEFVQVGEDRRGRTRRSFRHWRFHRADQAEPPVRCSDRRDSHDSRRHDKQLQEFRFAARTSRRKPGSARGWSCSGLTVSIGKSKLGSEAQTKAFDALAKAAHTTVAELRRATLGKCLSRSRTRSQRSQTDRKGRRLRCAVR